MVLISSKVLFHVTLYTYTMLCAHLDELHKNPGQARSSGFQVTRKQLHQWLQSNRTYILHKTAQKIIHI